MKTLEIFDFDGTLFKSPLNTKENKDIYLKETGIPWEIDKKNAQELSKKLGKKIYPRSGWFGRPETLMPPFVPNPVPQNMWIQEIVDRFLESKNSSNVITVLMTGRHKGIQSEVLRILHQADLVKIEKKGEKYFQADENVTCLFQGDDGPFVKGFPKINHKDTISWKLWIIEKYLNFLQELETINIWEDRDEHVVEFQQLNEIFPQKFNVFHVK